MASLVSPLSSFTLIVERRGLGGEDPSGAQLFFPYSEFHLYPCLLPRTSIQTLCSSCKPILPSWHSRAEIPIHRYVCIQVGHIYIHLSLKVIKLDQMARP